MRCDCKLTIHKAICFTEKGSNGTSLSDLFKCIKDFFPEENPKDIRIIAVKNGIIGFECVLHEKSCKFHPDKKIPKFPINLFRKKRR